VEPGARDVVRVSSEGPSGTGLEDLADIVASSGLAGSGLQSKRLRKSAPPVDPGASRKKLVRMLSAIGGAVVGLSSAALFYLIQPIVGYAPAMFILFFGLWIELGLLTGRVLQQRDSMRAVLVRSALAAIGSGLGFYAISGIWFPFNPHGWDYAIHFVYWTLGYLPGFIALLLPYTKQLAVAAQEDLPVRDGR